MDLQVLIVDDDEIVIFLHEVVVVKSGLSPAPLSFKDGKAALDYLQEQYQEGVHYLVLLDINMPIMNGWEFLEALQIEPCSSCVSVVMVTSSINGLDREKARQYKQVVDFVEKPLHLEACERIKHLPAFAGSGDAPGDRAVSGSF